MKTTMNKINKIVIVMLSFVIAIGAAIPTFAASREVPITKMNMTSRITIKVGETRTINVTSTPTKTTYKTKIDWSSNTMGNFTIKTNGKGTYFGQSSSVTIKGTEAGTGFITAWVKLYDSKKRYVTDYPVGTIITVVPKVNTVSKASVTQSKSTNTKSNTTAKTNSKTTTSKVSSNKTKSVTKTNSDKYLNVNEAYTVLNKFRTTRSNQWYWNANNKTKTYTYGLKSLKRDTTLENIAKIRAKEQWTRWYVQGKRDHTKPNGQSCWTSYTKNSRYCGECLHWWNDSTVKVFTDPNYGFAETNKKYKDQGHRRLMLDKKATRVGIACYEKNGDRCWAVCFGY